MLNQQNNYPEANTIPIGVAETFEMKYIFHETQAPLNRNQIKVGLLKIYLVSVPRSTNIGAPVNFTGLLSKGLLFK